MRHCSGSKRFNSVNTWLQRNVAGKVFAAFFLSSIIISFFALSSCKKVDIERSMSIRSDSVFNIKTRSAIARSTIEDVGNGIISYGHLWDTIQALNTESNKTEQFDLKEAGNFDSDLSDLLPGKTYYVKSYGYDGSNYQFSNVISFQTLANSVPILKTGAVLIAEPFLIRIEGEISSLGPGESQILQYGHCFSDAPNPTCHDSVSSKGQTNSVTNFISELSIFHGTTYYIRAYAINEFDTAYGEEISVQIPDISPAVSIEIDYASITSSRATTYLTCDYGPFIEIYTFGLCWDTDSLPEITGKWPYRIPFTPDWGLQSTSLDAYDLSPNTTYYLRGFVETNLGVFYSNEINFTTRSN